ncbi:MAG: hypothetical protein CL581_16350 [Alteromonadaceae bacterium]|nr:hypothetical protein [Alteromonadaceae bacterium]
MQIDPEDFLVNYEIIVAEEPCFKKGGTSAEDLCDEVEMMTAVHILQVVDEDEDVVVGISTCRFQGTDLVSVSGQAIIPKKTIRHRAPLELVDGPPEQPRESLAAENLEIPEGIPEDLYPLTPEERRYRGYE